MRKLLLIGFVILCGCEPSSSARDQIIYSQQQRIQELENQDNEKALQDLKPGEYCITLPWAFSESYPCNTRKHGTFTARAENRNGVIYVDGKTLEENSK